MCNFLSQQGHGPFSHLFDQLFIPEVCPDTMEDDEKWKLTKKNYTSVKQNRHRTYIVSHAYVCCSLRTCVVIHFLSPTLDSTNKVHSASVKTSLIHAQYNSGGLDILHTYPMSKLLGIPRLWLSLAK